VDYTLYWRAFDEPAEAHFLTAVLDAASTNKAIKPFQSTGLLGERDVTKKLLDLPIPLFNAEVATHRKLSELGLDAHRQAQAAIIDQNFPHGASLARQRAYIRTALAETLSKIDDLVKTLLGLGKG
jgi:hypothetical protein